MSKELVLLKIGGSVITKKDEDIATVLERNVRRISKEIVDAINERDFKLIIVHGAGPFGHIPANRYKLNNGLKNKKQISGFVKTHQSMERLNYKVVEILQENGLNAVAFQPSACGILKNRRLVCFPIDVMKRFIEIGIIPVSYGDVLLDEDTGINILSGDHLVPYIAEKLKADKIIMATDVKGIYDSDPKENKNARFIPEITSNNIKYIGIGNSRTMDVTGGMRRKVEELMRVAETGIEIRIVSGIDRGILKKALLGEHVGTVIKY